MSTVCEYFAHVDCQDFAIPDCKENATYVPGKDLSSVKHQVSELYLFLTLCVQSSFSSISNKENFTVNANRIIFL